MDENNNLQQQIDDLRTELDELKTLVASLLARPAAPAPVSSGIPSWDAIFSRGNMWTYVDVETVKGFSSTLGDDAISGLFLGWLQKLEHRGLRPYGRFKRAKGAEAMIELRPLGNKVDTSWFVKLGVEQIEVFTGTPHERGWP